MRPLLILGDGGVSLARHAGQEQAETDSRFSFRFLAPHHDRLAFAPQEALQLIQANLRSFVGQTGFEELCRQWVSERAAAGALPLTPTAVGSHWSRSVQVDVVAMALRADAQRHRLAEPRDLARLT